MARQSAVESVGVSSFGDVYVGRRVLVSGHTGFKGSWLALWLAELGAEVHGLALSPSTSPNHWELLDLKIPDHRVDVRDSAAVQGLIGTIKPEFVIHLAAQSLVRASYRDPVQTWSTNVIGTVNILEACRHCDGVLAILVVTTDKCYESQEWEWGYRENDRLGGHDPYSASKAAAELVASSYRAAFFDVRGAPLVASARAGNVIGGGDWSEDRLVPDLVRALTASRSLEIRSPHATRPWQHVLESLTGYLLLGRKLLEGRAEFARAWNFGPDVSCNRTVADVLTCMQVHWPDLAWHTTTRPHPHETKFLYLDSSSARTRLDWKQVWHLDEALRATADWYSKFLHCGRVETRAQLTNFVSAARALGREWASR